MDGILLVTLLEVFFPALDAGRHHSAVDVVERFRVRPRLFDVINLELDVRIGATRTTVSNLSYQVIRSNGKVIQVRLDRRKVNTNDLH